MSDFKRCGKNEFMKELVKEFDLDSSEESFSKYNIILDNVIEEFGLKFNPGLENLLQHLYKNNIPMAIATNIGDTDFQVYIKILQA